MHVMIDLETLGTKPDAVMVQVAAVAFELRSGGPVRVQEAFNMYVDPDSSMRWGLTCEGRTITWWMGQSDAARRRIVDGVTNDGRDLEDVMQALMEWPRQHLGTEWSAVEGVWAKPAPFDLPILKTAFDRVLQKSPPWDRRREFDARTVYYLMGGAPQVDFVGVQHDALDDCVFQIQELQVAMGTMRD